MSASNSSARVSEATNQGSKLSDRTAAFVDVFRRSAERTRVACGLVAIISVVSLAAFNNLRNENWAVSRLKFQSEFQQRLLARVKVAASSSGLPDATPLTSTHISLSPDETDELVKLSRDTGIQTVGQLREFVGKYREAVIDAKRIQIPIAGLSFDSNDMGLVFGISLVVFSLFLFKSIRRERRATLSCFEEAERQRELDLAYSLMSLEEVLMRPDNLDSDRNSKFITFNASRPLIRRWLDSVPVQSVVATMPLICLFLISAFDFASRGTGFKQSVVSTWIVLIAEGLCLLTLGFVVWQTSKVVTEISEIWAAARDIIHRERESSKQAAQPDGVIA